MINNSINILNNIGKIKISKNIRIDSKENIYKSFNKKEEDFFIKETSSEINNLDYSVIFDLIEKNKYKEYIQNLYSDIDEINESAKILNMSI